MIKVTTKICYKTSAEVYIDTLGGLSLFPKNRQWFAGNHDLILFRLEFSVYYSVHGALVGIIHKNQLQELNETGTLLPIALSILRLYRWLNGGGNLQVKSLLETTLESCIIEAKTFGEGEPMAYFYQLANWSVTKVDLRLDWYGLSVCTGATAVSLIFLFPEVVSESSARIWFLDGDAFLFLALPMEELAEVWTRIRFGDEAVWREGTGTEKEITYAGKLMKAKDMYSIRHAEYSRYNMASKRVLWVAARNDSRQAY